MLPFSASYLSYCLFLRTLSPSTATCFFFLMIRRPPRSTLDRSSAASDVYKRQLLRRFGNFLVLRLPAQSAGWWSRTIGCPTIRTTSVSYTHLRAHETVLDLVCRLLLEKKNKPNILTSLLVHYMKHTSPHSPMHSIIRSQNDTYQV